jgi:DnaJ-class molecular chaperone
MRQDGGPDLTRREEPTECKPVFQEYFSVESLFAPPDATEEAIRARPWTVLGVPEDASWADIQSAHRRLAKQLHPDRFVGASDAQRRWAEEAIRRVNEAMADLRAVYPGVQH